MSSTLVNEPSAGQPKPVTIAQVLLDREVRSVFQPIVDLGSGQVVGLEALARGPVGPLESPTALFGAARQAGMLAELDSACRQAAFRGTGDRGLVAPFMLFVNVEPEVLDGAPLADLMALADAAPGHLRVMLEITERALAARPAELLRTVDRMRELGWRVALDDVGAEPASLAFMALLEPDVVKLDLALTRGRPPRLSRPRSCTLSTPTPSVAAHSCWPRASRPRRTWSGPRRWAPHSVRDGCSAGPPTRPRGPARGAAARPAGNHARPEGPGPR